MTAAVAVGRQILTGAIGGEQCEHGEIVLASVISSGATWTQRKVAD